LTPPNDIPDLNGKQHIVNGKDAEAAGHQDECSGDAVQRTMGQLGRWQILVCAAISLVKFPVAWHQLAIVFMAPKQSYNCTAPGYGNSADQCHVLVNGTQHECTKWEFDRSLFPETIISQVGTSASRRLLRIRTTGATFSSYANSAFDLYDPAASLGLSLYLLLLFISSLSRPIFPPLILKA
jgi:hypothetical protein